jgi:hypothetical protein
LFNSIFYAVGIIVLIFAIIQLATPDFKIAEKGWDPRKLKAVPDPERIKPVGQVAEIIFNIFAIVLFNLFPQWVGVSSFYNGQWFTAPILTRTFIQFIPWLSLLWALQAGFHIILLAQGRWSTITRWFLVCLNVFGITIGIRLIVGPALISLEPLTMLNLGWDISNPASVQLAGELSNTAIRLAIGVAIAVQAWEIIQILYRIILRGRVSHAVAPK